jgi:hypothetical protein
LYDYSSRKSIAFNNTKLTSFMRPAHLNKDRQILRAGNSTGLRLEDLADTGWTAAPLSQERAAFIGQFS